MRYVGYASDEKKPNIVEHSAYPEMIPFNCCKTSDQLIDKSISIGLHYFGNEIYIERNTFIK